MKIKLKNPVIDALQLHNDSSDCNNVREMMKFTNYKIETKYNTPFQNYTVLYGGKEIKNGDWLVKLNEFRLMHLTDDDFNQIFEKDEIGE